MATGGEESLTLEDMVECDVCMEVMVKPQALPCLHHFCLKCTSKLDRVMEDGDDSTIGVLCPFCRKFTPETSIQDSFMMNNLIEMYYNKQALPTSTEPSSAKLCTQCDRPDVKYICTDCKIDLCELCKDRHLRIPNCREHTISAIDEVENEALMSTVEKYCPKHPRNVIKYNCVPCNIAICIDCKMESHDDHPTESVDEALKRIIESAKKHIESVHENSDKISMKLAQVQDMKEKVSSNLDETKQKIHDHSEAVIAKVQENTDELLEKVESSAAAQIKHLNIIEEELHNKLASHDSLLAWSNTIMNITQGAGALCELQGGLIKKIESYGDTEAEQPVPDISTVEFRPMQMEENLVGNVRTLDEGIQPEEGQRSDKTVDGFSLMEKLRELGLTQSETEKQQRTLKLQRQRLARQIVRQKQMEQLKQQTDNNRQRPKSSWASLFNTSWVSNNPSACERANKETEQNNGQQPTENNRQKEKGPWGFLFSSAKASNSPRWCERRDKETQQNDHLRKAAERNERLKNVKAWHEKHTVKREESRQQQEEQQQLREQHRQQQRRKQQQKAPM